MCLSNPPALVVGRMSNHTEIARRYKHRFEGFPELLPRNLERAVYVCLNELSKVFVRCGDGRYLLRRTEKLQNHVVSARRSS